MKRKKQSSINELKTPWFIYHGTTSECYDNIKRTDLTLNEEGVQCWNEIISAIQVAGKRARQRDQKPVVLVIESSKHDVQRVTSNIYLVLGKLNPEGYVAIEPYNPSDPRFIDQYQTLECRQNSAKSLADFLE